MSELPNNEAELEPVPVEAQAEAEVKVEAEVKAGSADEPSLPEEQYCIFRAGRERFCLQVREVDEVVEWPRLTKVPLAPPFLMGVFNLRGTIVPVVDIAVAGVRRADMPPKLVLVACLRAGIDASKTGASQVRLGLAVDEVLGTFCSSEPLLTNEIPRDLPHCLGMLRHGDRLALALDVQHVLEAFPAGAI
jgi:purine-binding chemotaxis protein CheW